MDLKWPILGKDSSAMEMRKIGENSRPLKQLSAPPWSHASFTTNFQRPPALVEWPAESAEQVDVQHVQAITPRAATVVQEVSTPRETFKDAKGFWLYLVTLGLLLLGGACALSVGGIRHNADDAMLTKFKTGFVAGPGGPKLWILDVLLQSPTAKPWALGSVIIYAIGVLALMWPEHVGVMGVAGIGRLIACLMAVAALI